MRTILVLDDETLILMFVEDVLLELGHGAIATSREEEALEAMEAGGIAGAILDVNLGGGRNSFAVARRLMELGVPFAFASGYGVAPDTPEFGVRPLLSKPFNSDDIAAVVGELLDTQ